jgi:hypothetical protein
MLRVLLLFQELIRVIAEYFLKKWILSWKRGYAVPFEAFSAKEDIKQ